MQQQKRRKLFNATVREALRQKTGLFFIYFTVTNKNHSIIPATSNWWTPSTLSEHQTLLIV
jgi:hypothetical protein